MLLSDRDILAAQAEGHISLEPWTPEMVQPASIDVRLDRFFRLFNNHAYTYVDPAENQGELTEQFEVGPDEPWILHPGEFALGSTWEYVKLDATLAARLEGKSSLGRLGILTHSTAGFIDLHRRHELHAVRADGGGARGRRHPHAAHHAVFTRSRP